MKLIPVIDLKKGLVVQAKKGQRHLYEGIISKLYHGTDPLEFVRIFVENFKFQSLYIADLDAITKTGNHIDLIESISERYPKLKLLVDAGLTCLEKLPKACIPILGTENNIDAQQLKFYSEQYPSLVLSIDFNSNGYWGNKEILAQTNIWPGTIIVMNLDNVGSDDGLQLQRLEEIQSLTKNRTIYYAGGIRNKKDLAMLHKRKVDGVLLASALHNASINIDYIKSLH